jgi:hypothetical protein
MKPGAVWLLADAEQPVCVKRTIASEKRMLIVFWGIYGIAQYYWLPKDSILDSPSFCEDVLSFLTQKMHLNSKKPKPLTSIHPDNARVHTARETQEKLDVSRFKCTPQPPHSQDFAPSDFFFSVGRKPSLNGENIMEKINYMK